MLLLQLHIISHWLVLSYFKHHQTYFSPSIPHAISLRAGHIPHYFCHSRTYSTCYFLIAKFIKQDIYLHTHMRFSSDIQGTNACAIHTLLPGIRLCKSPMNEEWALLTKVSMSRSCHCTKDEKRYQQNQKVMDYAVYANGF